MTRSSPLGRILATAYVWAPCLVVVAFAAPSIDYMLPSYYCHLGESYQPLRALSFFHSLGTGFHKYGPMPNFLLAPGYALSMGYWWLTGTFANPSGEFPYGLRDPLHQISFLLLQGRALFLVLFVGLFASLLVSLREATSNRMAIALAFLFCVGTNYSALSFAAFTRPDGPMLAFLGASLGVYLRILYNGLTVRRGVWLSLLAVFAISSKENAGPVYLLPYLGLGWVVARECREDPARRAPLIRAVLSTLGTGVASYLVLNVVYAPATWVARISHWLAGSGADSAVWGGVSSGEMSASGFAIYLAETFLNTLGPGGTVVVGATLLALAITRPPRSVLLLLPFASVLFLSLIPLGYGSDYFTSVATVALVPPVAVGLAEIHARATARWQHSVLGAVVSVALVVNLVFANFAWLRLDGLYQRVLERTLLEDPPGEASISLGEFYPEIPGKSRLVWLGYRVDPRSLQQIIDSEPALRPDRIYLSSGMRGFIEDALSQPARAAMLRAEGFDVASWKGIEPLGYRLSRVAETSTPAWFFFDWMPAVKLWKGLSPIYVYRRDGAEPHDS